MPCDIQKCIEMQISEEEKWSLEMDVLQEDYLKQLQQQQNAKEQTFSWNNSLFFLSPLSFLLWDDRKSFNEFLQE